MISIFVSTDVEGKVRNAIASEDRLDELVAVKALNTAVPDTKGGYITVDKNGIYVSPDWFNLMPPILFPEVVRFDANILLGIIFCQLGNFEKSYQYLAGYTDILQPADLMNRLINNEQMDGGIPGIAMEDFTSLHNRAIIFQYGAWQEVKSFSETAAVYLKALECTTNAERKAFTVKHFAAFLTDTNQYQQAEQLIEIYLSTAISADASNELKTVLCNIWLKQLTVPYDQVLLEKLKATLWDCLQYYEANHRSTETALLLIDASQLANISNSFAESLGYINKAIAILQAENLTALMGSALLRKGMLLYTWAQNGQPQFYRTALQVLQEALIIFDRENAPDIFADIHHHLGVIYSEIQDEVKKRGLWAAVSVASFTEALNFYNKVDYPYEFAMICHHFGNAYTKYPAALHSDNFDKALAWYREALDIRTAAHYPIERCNTLCNYLEASWLTGNAGENFNADRYDEMWAMANELLLLTNDDGLKAEAVQHMEQLKKLKENFNTEAAETTMISPGIEN